MNDTVKLARKRPTKYTVRYNNGIKDLLYTWAGCPKGGKPFVTAVPREVFDYLNMATNTIRSGALVIADEQPDKTEILNEIIDAEEVEKNSHTREEIEKLLKGNLNSMKKELKAITAKQEKLFVKQVKDELAESEGLNNTKIEFIDEWFKAEPTEQSVE